MGGVVHEGGYTHSAFIVARFLVCKGNIQGPRLNEATVVGMKENESVGEHSLCSQSEDDWTVAEKEHISHQQQHKHST